MKKSYNPISDVRNENVELTRRLYRAISDASRHLDDRRGRAQTCSDLFLPTLEAQRVKLREYCERLIFSDPVGYGRKGEELLWRKGYYDVVTTAKRLRKNNTWSPVEIAYVQGHLSAGIGHYHHLLFRLQIEYRLDLHGYVDFPLLVIDSGLSKDKSSSGKALDNNCVDWAKQAAHRCLVYLGDLCRYVLDLHPRWDTGLAVRYYLQALNLNMEIGMPHNQLGTLSGTLNYGLDAAYHYMRCLTCKQPFEGAEGNLQRLLDRNLQWVEQHLNSQNHRVEGSVSLSPAEHVHQLVARFLLLIDSWFFGRKSTIETHQVCHQMLLDLQQCLGYSKPFPSSEECELKEDQIDLEHVSVFQGAEEDQENLDYLKEDLICKMVVMSLLCVSKLQSNKIVTYLVEQIRCLEMLWGGFLNTKLVQQGSQQVSAVVAFTLAMFSQLIQQVIHHIQDSVFNMSFPTSTTPPSTIPAKASGTPTSAFFASNDTSGTSPSESNFPPVNSCEDSNKIIDSAPCSQNMSDKSSSSENTVAVVNGTAENAQESKTAAKKKKHKSLHKLRRRRRRRRRRKNSSEESDLSDVDFPYGGGSSSSDDQKSDISENTEPNLDLSSDEDDDDDEDEDEDEDDDEEEETVSKLEKKQDNPEVNEKDTKVNSHNHVKVNEELCNGLSSESKAETPVTLNGMKAEDSSDSLIMSNSSTNNLESVSNKVVNNEEKEMEKGSVKKNQGLDPADLLELVADEGLLDAIKICADWLHGNSDIIKACGQSSRTLLSRFITMLNLINVDAQAFENGTGVGNFFKLRNIQEVFKKIPLPEDVMLKGLPILKSVHETVDWEYVRHHSLHAKEEALLRVYKLVDFGHFLVSITDIGVKYDPKEKLFVVEDGLPEEKMVESSTVNVTYMYMKSDPFVGLGSLWAVTSQIIVIFISISFQLILQGNGTLVVADPKTKVPEENNCGINHNAGPATNRNPNTKKGQLMHNMGQLWLRAEVRDLESRVRRRGATFSPYLAVDSDALINYIHLVKQLVGARKFIILIPSIVVSALDELKREIGKARETIRWLESQFQRGNRFLRAQRSHERLPLPLMKYPKKKDKEAWLFFQVVECCHYFSQQTGIHETHPETALVTLLTGHKSSAKDDTTKGFSPLGVAKSAGINLEHIETFHAKWKTSSKSHG